MDVEALLKILILCVGFYMAWNIGANDVSNAMGTSVGSGALTLRRAVMIAAVLEFSGAYFLGANVSETMQNHLIDVSRYSNDHMTLILGMCGALLGTGIWLQIASYFGLPVSTTHAIIGAILGFGVLTLGFSGIHWNTIGSIALSWVISPVFSGIVSYLIFKLLQRHILFALNPSQATRRIIPILLFFVFGTFSLSLFFNGLGRFHLDLSVSQTLLLSVGFGALAFFIGLLLTHHFQVSKIAVKAHSRYLPLSLISIEKAIKHLQRVKADPLNEAHQKIATLLDELYVLKKDIKTKTALPDPVSEYNFVEKAFGFMQIISACFVAFAHGANDVANAIAPVATVLETIQSKTLIQATAIPSWLLAFGGLGIVVGLATWGWRVIETIGKKITELTPTRGFSAEFGAALTILLASKMGMPISTTHCLVGAVLGVGLAGGIRALNLRTLREIVLSWAITIPASAFVSILCYYLLKALIV